MFWQNVWNGRQIEAVIEEKSPIKENSFVEESVIFTLPYQTNRNHARELSTVGHVISERHWKSTFDFTEIVNNSRLKQGTVCQICEIYFPLFSETIHTNFKNIFTAWS